MTSELKQIIESANGIPRVIIRFKDIKNVRIDGTINVLVEETLFEEIEYVSKKFNIQIISKDQFYNFCLKQHLPYRSLML